MSQDELLNILSQQLHHLKQTNYSSFDLCDITSKHYFLWVNEFSQNKKWGKYIKYPHNILLDNTSSTLRKILNQKPQDFAQSNALIVRGLLKMYSATQNTSYLDEAKLLIERIESQRSLGYEHSAWGQPYDWFSGQVIPAYTPRTTVTSQVGRMYLDAYDIIKDDVYLEKATDIAQFFVNEMPLSHEDDNTICYSYTTIDQHKVHNPNMMASAFLTLVWEKTGSSIFIEKASKALNFTFSHINVDGSWYYASLPDKKVSKIDNYHTGYNLESALLIKKTLPEFPYEKELESAINYYESNLFANNGIPYLTNIKKYPTDIQCCAQSIITYCYITDILKKPISKAARLFQWTHKNMYLDGWYFYRMTKNGKKDKTDYIRWGNAWMFLAGSLLLKKYND